MLTLSIDHKRSGLYTKQKSMLSDNGAPQAGLHPPCFRSLSDIH